jgi:hypothetical protein
MGYGDYSYQAHQTRTNARSSAPTEEVFQQRTIHPLMSPFGVKSRESRDSVEHPNSLGVVFALDVTGSMGQIPVQLAKTELPHFMKTLLDCGVTDPQILFMCIGDAAHDKGPLQVGQFESSDEGMDQWLTWSWLEGGGGGNGSESYDLAMYFAARHLEMDCILKRKKRGYFFMTGDENPYPSTSKKWVQLLLGDQLPDDVPLEQVCEEISRSFHAFFMIPEKGRVDGCEAAWRKLLGDHVICLATPADTCYVSAGLICLSEGYVKDLKEFAHRLDETGLDRKRVVGIVQALTPYAATIHRDGVPTPNLEPVAFPEDGASGHQRP